MPQPCMQLHCCLPAGISGLGPRPPTLPLLPLACCSLNALLGQPASVCLFLPFLSSSYGLLERLASVAQFSRAVAPLPGQPSSGSQVRLDMRRGAPPPLPLSRRATPPSQKLPHHHPSPGGGRAGQPQRAGVTHRPSHPALHCSHPSPQPAALPPQAAHHDLHYEPRQQEVRSRGLPRPFALDFPSAF